MTSREEFIAAFGGDGSDCGAIMFELLNRGHFDMLAADYPSSGSDARYAIQGAAWSLWAAYMDELWEAIKLRNPDVAANVEASRRKDKESALSAMVLHDLANDPEYGNFNHILLGAVWDISVEVLIPKSVKRKRLSYHRTYGDQAIKTAAGRKLVGDNVGRHVDAFIEKHGHFREIER